mmetsp:Transcript_55855/g.92402  ORF Transcript_55855/g.92402 Transcript_55855/m.92402 type:complete len:712 (-) Transcript_55855:108-2243(-)
MHKYSLTDSVFDLLVLDLLRWLGVILCAAGARWAAYGWWAAFCGLTLCLFKAVVYRYVNEEGPWEASLIGVSACFAGLELLLSTSLFWRTTGSKASQPAGPKDTLTGEGATMRALLLILRPYFWPHGIRNKLRTCMTFMIMAASKACNLFAPLYLGSAVFELSKERRVPLVRLGVYAVLKFASQALAQVQPLVYMPVQQVAFTEISVETFQHLHSLSTDWHLKKKMGQVLRVMDRGIASADNVIKYLILMLLPAFVEMFITFVIFYAHFKSPILAAAAFVAIVAYVTMTVEITKWRAKHRKATNKHDNDWHDRATDSLVNFETVKCFAAEAREVAAFKCSVEQYQKHATWVSAGLSVLNALQQLDIQLTTLVSLCVFASVILRLYGDPARHIGDFVAVNAYVMQLFTPLSALGTIYGVITQAIVDLSSLSSILSLSPDVKDISHAPPLHILDPNRAGVSVSFEEVCFSYPSNAQAGLFGVSFNVSSGRILALVGPTGSGKSTVSRILLRFYDVGAGRVLIDGQDISRVSQQSLRMAIGIVPQDTVLFNATIENNIRYGKADAPFSEVESAASLAQILPTIARMPDRWNSLVGERGLRLSGGEKQRVAIARCLLKNPPIVILDEATSALDSTTEVAVQEALATLGRGRTQLVIAHRLSTIMHADEIIVLERGRIAERGNHSTLLERAAHYHRLWTAQIELDARSASQEAAGS